MNRRTLLETLIVLLLIVLVVLLVNPFDIWMPDAMEMIIVGLFLVAWVFFAGLVWNERARDEREHHHRMLSGRIAYLIATFGLALATAVQTFQHNLDPWIPTILAVTVVAKIVSASWLLSRQ